MLGLVALIFADASVAQGAPVSPYRVSPKAAIQALPFPIERVRLTDSPFKHAQDLDHKYLLSLDADRLLAWFRRNAGLPPKAEVYGGWESRQVAGHTLGHYLTACSFMFAATGDAKLKKRVDYIVSELEACVKNRADGFLAAMPDSEPLWEAVRSNGTLNGRGSYLNGYWAPWYTLHKQYAGLMDAYKLCGNSAALEVCMRSADWAIEVTRNLTPENWQRMLDGEFGGMNECMAELYALTGAAKYLELARKFHHSVVMDPLEKGERRLAGLHGNTQIPKAIGCARIYELTGEERFRKIAENFWSEVVEDHTYAIGGNTSGEHFGPPKELSTRLTSNAAETCNTYNMLQLTRRLFSWDPASSLGDFYERALYNHILASQNPENGMVCYYVSLQPGGMKSFSTPFDSFWCCVGTGMENHARYGEAIYFHSEVHSDSGSAAAPDPKLWVNLFIPSTLDWKEQGVRVSQESLLPEEGMVRLRFDCDKPTRLELLIRLPSWARGEVRSSLNGAPRALLAHRSGFGALVREFKSGDVVEVRFGMAPSLRETPDNPRVAAIQYGPTILAGDLGPSSEPAPRPLPSLVTEDRPVEEWLESTQGNSLEFRTKAVGRPHEVRLIPFWRLYDRRYTVYWDLLTVKEWEEREAQRKAEESRLRALDARTVDRVQIGLARSEREHNLQSQNSASGEHMGRRWRHATDGGWFSYDLKVDSNNPNELLTTFWGSDSGRTFDVLVDGARLATIRLFNNKPNQFFDDLRRIPEEMTKGKQKITVRFQAPARGIAGGIFDLRVLKPARGL